MPPKTKNKKATNNLQNTKTPNEVEAHAFTTNQDREIKLDILCAPAERQEMHLAVGVKNREEKKVGAQEVENLLLN